MCDVHQMKLQIKELQEKIKEAEKAEAILTPTQKIAKSLHSMFCNWNHIDGCGWFYEMRGSVDDWNGYAHADYLKKAEKFSRVARNHGIMPESMLELLVELKKERVI